MNELPTRRSINPLHLLISIFLPNREEARMKDDADTDHGAGLAKEEAKLDDNVTQNHSPGSDLCNVKISAS
jgi:hypothetical protein